MNQFYILQLSDKILMFISISILFISINSLSANNEKAYWEGSNLCDEPTTIIPIALNSFENELVCSKSTKCCKEKKNSSATIQPIASGLWYQSSVWPNGQLPTINDDVFIPTGISVYMAGTCRARKIEVAGTLTAVNWQVTGAWIDLQTKAVHVLNGGLFQIGTESAPYQATCTITLIGQYPCEVLCPSMGTKRCLVEE